MTELKQLVQCVDAQRACALSGVSRPMLDYLSREEMLLPSGSSDRKRGKRRLYTFGDVVVLRVIGRLLASGIEVRRLRRGLKKLQQRTAASTPGELSFRYLVTNGAEIFLKGPDGKFETLTGGGQLAFAFLIDMRHSEAEVLKAGRQFGGWAAVAGRATKNRFTGTVNRNRK